MGQVTSSLNLILLGNSLLAILFILNQNESSKETNANSNSVTNPLENFTWGCLFLQLILLLIKTKTTDF
jgi:hypothetical protein